jgi:hypothetical protein
MTDNSASDGGNIDALAQRAVDSFMTLVRRGTALAGGTLAIVFFICVSGFLLGVAALSDEIQTIWIIVGGAFAVLGIGAVVVAIFRLLKVKRHAVALVREVHDLIAGDARSERVVIETLDSSDDVQGQSAVVMSRQFFSMQDSVDGRTDKFQALSSALKAITSFPLLMLLAVVITISFVGFALIFTLALAI